jgi:hypothetical protein
LAFCRYLADGSNLVSINGNIGAVGFCARTVDYQAITNHQVMHAFYSLFSGVFLTQTPKLLHPHITGHYLLL